MSCDSGRTSWTVHLSADEDRQEFPRLSATRGNRLHALFGKRPCIKGSHSPAPHVLSLMAFPRSRTVVAREEHSTGDEGQSGARSPQRHPRARHTPASGDPGRGAGQLTAQPQGDRLPLE